MKYVLNKLALMTSHEEASKRKMDDVSKFSILSRGFNQSTYPLVIGCNNIEDVWDRLKWSKETGDGQATQHLVLLAQNAIMNNPLLNPINSNPPNNIFPQNNNQGSYGQSYGNRGGPRGRGRGRGRGGQRSTGTCNYCNIPGHKEESCYQKFPDLKVQHLSERIRALQNVRDQFQSGQGNQQNYGNGFEATGHQGYKNRGGRNDRTFGPKN